jgi:hypothetical protein
MEFSKKSVNRKVIVQTKTPAANILFCVIAAVTPLKQQWKFKSLYPAGNVVLAEMRERPSLCELPKNKKENFKNSRMCEIKIVTLYRTNK